MTVTDEAVEAAAKAVFLTGYPEGCGATWNPASPSAQAIMRDIRVALEAAAPHLAQPVIHDVDWALSILQKCGIETADQFDALVTLQKLTP